jgi:hypothetical protein
MLHTYLTTDELASRIKYDARTIRNRLVDNVLLEGRHYVRPFSGRKFLFIWERIESGILATAEDSTAMLIAMESAHV